jgi:hypothetical protein
VRGNEGGAALGVGDVQRTGGGEGSRVGQFGKGLGKVRSLYADGPSVSEYDCPESRAHTRRCRHVKSTVGSLNLLPGLAFLETVLQ